MRGSLGRGCGADLDVADRDGDLAARRSRRRPRPARATSAAPAGDRADRRAAGAGTEPARPRPPVRVPQPLAPWRRSLRPGGGDRCWRRGCCRPQALRREPLPSRGFRVRARHEVPGRSTRRLARPDLALARGVVTPVPRPRREARAARRSPVGRRPAGSGVPGGMAGSGHRRVRHRGRSWRTRPEPVRRWNRPGRWHVHRPRAARGRSGRRPVRWPGAARRLIRCAGPDRAPGRRRPRRPVRDRLSALA